jgi:hypothetical protein
MADIAEFMAPSTEVIPDTKTRKRKSSFTPETDTRQKARSLCKSADQWKIVSKYSEQRLYEFISEKQFDAEHGLHDTVFNFAHRLWALSVDKIAGGHGHIQNELINDLSLREAIQAEGIHFVQYLTNRWKIAALTSVDLFNGKQKYLASRADDIEINGTNCTQVPESTSAMAESETSAETDTENHTTRPD